MSALSFKLLCIRRILMFHSYRLHQKQTHYYIYSHILNNKQMGDWNRLPAFPWMSYLKKNKDVLFRFILYFFLFSWQMAAGCYGLDWRRWTNCLFAWSLITLLNCCYNDCICGTEPFDILIHMQWRYQAWRKKK